MIRLVNTWYKYPGSKNWALKNINLVFREDKAYAVIGPNASGKTTLLKITALLYKPVKGRIEAWDKDYWSLPRDKMIELRRRIVYVHEKPILLRGTVLHNLAYGLILRGHDKQTAEKKASRLLEKLGLTSLAHKKNKQLSAGEAQLVAILRAIILEPRILVLDEPLAHLDTSKRKKILELLTILKQTGTGIIIATHDYYIAETLTEKTIQLENGEITTTTQEIPLKPSKQ